MAGRPVGDDRSVSRSADGKRTRSCRSPPSPRRKGSKRGVVGVFLDSGREDPPADPGVDRRRTGSADRRPGSHSRSTCSQKLGRNVDRGHKIAATGEIFLERQSRPDRRNQAKDDRRARGGCGCLPRPGGQNAADARKYADGLRIIPVKSFQQALHALATLPNWSARNLGISRPRKGRKLRVFSPGKPLIRGAPRA